MFKQSVLNIGRNECLTLSLPLNAFFSVLIDTLAACP